MRSIRPYAWWVIPTLGVSAGLGAFLGYPVAWLAYAVFNVGGVWLYCDGRRSERSELWMKALAIVMVPVGVIGVLMSKGPSLTPAQAVTIGSDDETIRSESSRGAGLFNRGSV